MGIPDLAVDLKRDYDGNRASMRDYFSYFHNLLVEHIDRIRRLTE